MYLWNLFFKPKIKPKEITNFDVLKNNSRLRNEEMSITHKKMKEKLKDLNVKKSITWNNLIVKKTLKMYNNI